MKRLTLLTALLTALAVVLLLASCGQPSPEVEVLEPPPENETWIMPSKVEVGNFYPGARAELELDSDAPFTIHNGNDQPAEFSITFQMPGDTAEGFVAAPSAAQDWVIIADPAPVLAAKETRKILIAVEMPKGAEAPEKWEFWIVVKDASQTSMIQTELACRWLITMK